MTANGWVQIALYFVVLTALVVPLGRFMARVFEGERTFLSPVFRPVETVLYRAAGVDEDARAALAHLYGRDARLQCRGVPSGLRAATLPGGAAAQSCGHGRRRSGSLLQYRRQLHVEHQLAELRRREHDELSHPDGGADDAELRLRRDGHRARHRARSGLCACLGQDGRQFLGRPDAVHVVRAAAAFDCRGALPRLAGRAAEHRALCRRDHAGRRDADV